MFSLSRVSIRQKLLFLIAVFACLTGTVYTLVLFHAKRASLLAEIDATLLTAAYSAQTIVGETYHDHITDANSVSAADYRHTVDVYNRLCKKLGLDYIWSVLVLGPDQIVFTSATSPSKDVTVNDHAKFFETHTDPHAYDGALKAHDVHYSTFHNKWGEGRMVLIPKEDALGRTYMFGASLHLQDLNTLLRKTILQSVGAGIVLMTTALFATWLLAAYISSPIIALTAAARKIAEGDLDLEIKVRGSREITTLADSFATMQDAVKSQMSELFDSEQNLQITLNSIGDAVIATDAQGKVTRMNGVAEELTGWQYEDACGKSLDTVFVIVNAETREEVESPVMRVLAEGKVVGLANHTVLIARDGVERQIADSGAPIRHADGEMIGVVLVFRDVTHEYALEEQLRQAQKMEAIGQLAGGVAHDFNNLLSVILGNAELLTMALEGQPDIREHADDIVEASVRGADLTRQLLGFARKGDKQLSSVNLHEMISSVTKLLRRSVDPRVEICEDLKAEEACIVADSTQIHNAILNLGVNASDAMPDGGKLTFSTRLVTLNDRQCAIYGPDIKPGSYIEVRVRDTGCGMNHETRNRALEPFFTTKPQGKGTGLGLSSVYGTVAGHGGGLTINSRLGIGTLIRFVLPLSTKSPQKETKSTEPETAIEGHGHILIVDDQEYVRRFLRAALEKMGYDVTECADGVEAVECYGKIGNTIDLVVLDERMPKLNGDETFARLKEIIPDVRVLMASGDCDETVVSRLLDAGVVGFLRKPFRIAELADTLSRLIKSRNDSTG